MTVDIEMENAYNKNIKSQKPTVCKKKENKRKKNKIVP